VSALVLVADDDPFNLRLLQELCEGAGYRVVTAGNGSDVLDVVARERPDLILLDVAMPVLDGFEVLRIIKSDADLSSIPVVLVTASGDEESRSRGIELGADDYVTKPYRVFEIQQRVRNALRVRAAENEAARARERVRSTELVDPLTRAGTSQQLIVSLDYELTRAARYSHPLTCMVVRLANYVDIVEKGGQEAGEGVLMQLADGLRTCVRGIDHIFRSDLEEFVVLLPETDAEGAGVVRGRIDERATDRSLWGAAIEPTPDILVGVASFPDVKAESGTALLREALDTIRKR
jgi:diguanylate cyclase (GGDEF)-like protein